MIQASSLLSGKELVPGYRLRRFRGQGGFGSVWEAVADDGETVALKFLPYRDSASAAQEVRSIQIVGGLRHPHLVRIDQVWCHRGYIVIAMPLADGSLLDLLDAVQLEYGTALPPEDLCRYLKQAAAALDFLNNRQHVIDGRPVGIQHCDVKPSNLLLFGESVRLGDFGLSSLTTAPLKVHRRVGTLDYAAPEVFQGRLSDWTDQFSLALAYCHLRTGRLPFPSMTGGFATAPSRPAPDLTILPPAERPVIARALAAVPGERWGSCSELIAQLTRAVG